MKKFILKNIPGPVIAVAVIWLLSGCESTYYKTMESIGVHKRDINEDGFDTG